MNKTNQKKDKDGFILYKSFYEATKDLSLEEKGLLYDAIFTYQIENREIELPPVVKMAFHFIKSSFSINDSKYENICIRNQNNGTKGGRPKKPKKPKKPTGFLMPEASEINDCDNEYSKPKKPKKPDIDIDIDIDKDINNINNINNIINDCEKPKKPTGFLMPETSEIKSSEYENYQEEKPKKPTGFLFDDKYYQELCDNYNPNNNSVWFLMDSIHKDNLKRAVDKFVGWFCDKNDGDTIKKEHAIEELKIQSEAYKEYQKLRGWDYKSSFYKFMMEDYGQRLGEHGGSGEAICYMNWINILNNFKVKEDDKQQREYNSPRARLDRRIKEIRELEEREVPEGDDD